MIDIDDVRAYITSLDEYESKWCDEHGGVDASKICLKPERDMIAALLAEVERLRHKTGECVCDSSASRYGWDDVQCVWKVRDNEKERRFDLGSSGDGSHD